MGKPLNQQRRGKGSPAFTAPSHMYRVTSSLRDYDEKEKQGVVGGEVISFIDSRAHSALTMAVKMEDGNYCFMVAPEGIAIGDQVQFGKTAEIGIGNVLPLSEIPDGTPIFNIELSPGDGGKMVRSAGSNAHVVSHLSGKVYVSLASKKTKILSDECRAQIGIVSVGGRLENPIFKAGTKYHMVAAKAEYWPHVRGVAMSAYDHPFGGKQHHPGRSTCVARNAPPGQKVGLIGAGSVGRKKGKKVI